MTIATHRDEPAGGSSVLYNPLVRKIAFQLTLGVIVVFLIYSAASNAVDRLAQLHIASGFGFLDRPAGFDISQRPIEFSSQSSTNFDAFLIGLLNTLIVGALGIVFATLIGFVVGISRLSRNWLLSNIATVYVELLRNIPLLLQLYFWYRAVLKPLPGPRQSVTVGNAVFLNNRGIYLPAFDFGGSGAGMLVALVLALIAAAGVAVWGRRRQYATGRRPPVGLISLALILGLPLLAFFLGGGAFTVSVPELKGFNLVGGVQITPEFGALLVGLTLYTAAFIAEIVRGGILAVSRGQTEASRAIGLTAGQTLRLVVVPQAMRVIIPPLANQYLNLVKNSSLAVAIGYPDLVQIFAGSVLNITNQAVECIAITMAVYLAISLLISAFMNWFNRRVALVER
jgi:general L-amino acid transport system permease protein